MAAGKRIEKNACDCWQPGKGLRLAGGAWAGKNRHRTAGGQQRRYTRVADPDERQSP
jgi:hypothetical protein